MKIWAWKMLRRFRYRITHTSKFPKGDLMSFLICLADRGFEPKHIVDVGANRGKWSQKARTIFPRCDFTLIEPQIEMKPFLDRFCRGHEGSRWLNAGVGAEMGRLPFTVCPNTVSSSFVHTAEQAKAAGFPRRSVRVITLDHLVANEIHTMPDMVKVDAEGFEPQIMRGAETLIGKTELFLLEAQFFGPQANPCRVAKLIGLMDELGYAPYDFTTFQKRPHDNANGLCEIAFARENGTLRSFHGWRTPAEDAA